MRILLDMDEVITDFIGAACKVHGIPRAVMEANRRPGEWSIVEPVGKAAGKPLMTLDEFWEPIHAAGVDFWTGLQTLPWASAVIGLVGVVTDDWHIVTAPSRAAGSYTGKVIWLKNYFGSKFDRFIISPHKEILANPTTVLIDDRAENCAKFTRAGGRAIVFPHAGNYRYNEVVNLVEVLTQDLKEVQNALDHSQRQYLFSDAGT